MKREVQRKFVKFTAEQKAHYEKAVQEEEAGKAENIAHAKQLVQQTKEARAELERVAELLKAERESQGLSLSDLQDRTGINKTALCRLENLSKGNPTIGTLNRIATALGKTLIVGLCDKPAS